MEYFGLIGYSIAFIAYLGFILLLVAANNRNIAGKLVICASFVSLISLALAGFQLEKHFSLKIVLLFESVKLMCWSILLIATKEGAQSFKLFLSNKKIQHYIFIMLTIVVLCWLSVIYLYTSSKVLFVLLLGSNLWLLVLLEQFYRSSEPKAKKVLWPLIIGLGMISVFDFIIFAQASLLNTLNFDLWYIRSLPAIISVPFLLLSTRRIKDWSVNVFISRDVVFYSSMLMISGIYLLLMAIAGYFINFIGGQWGTVVSWSFIILGLSVLATLLMTERLRREVKVFITKHFFANKYDYRVEWIKLIKQLESTDNNNDFYHTALNSLCTTLDVDKGLLVKRQSLAKYEMLSHCGIELTPEISEELTLVDEFCGSKGWIFDLQEYQKVEDSYPELFLNSDMFSELEIEVIAPIIFKQELYGFFLLSSPGKTKQMLNWEVRDLLATITIQLGHYLSLNEANHQLSQAKQFDAFNQMSAFLVHDLKNVQAQLALITANAQRHKNNPEFIEDVFETVESATERLEKVLSQLRNKQVNQRVNKAVKIDNILDKVIAQCNVKLPIVELTKQGNALILVDPEAFGSVICHLIQNAQEATKENGWVKVSVYSESEKLRLKIEDNGCGMSDAFIRTRLFRPFDTTKGNAGMGIGVYEAKQYFDSINGDITVESTVGQGTAFTIELPNSIYA